MTTTNLERFTKLQPQSVAQVHEPIDQSEVFRYLGYPVGHSPTQRIRQALDHWIDEAAAIAQPRAVYLVLPILDKNSRSLRVQAAHGPVEFKGAIGSFLGVSELIVAFIATAGSQLVERASDLMSQGDDLASLVVNSVGAERAEAAEMAAIDQAVRSVEEINFAATLPYSPGYCGMKLTEQRKLFSLFAGQTAGVELTQDCLMRPIKSVSGLVGLAPANRIETEITPCDRCELNNCNMRR